MTFQFKAKKHVYGVKGWDELPHTHGILLLSPQYSTFWRPGVSRSDIRVISHIIRVQIIGMTCDTNGIVDYVFWSLVRSSLIKSFDNAFTALAWTMSGVADQHWLIPGARGKGDYPWDKFWLCLESSVRIYNHNLLIQQCIASKLGTNGQGYHGLVSDGSLFSEMLGLPSSGWESPSRAPISSWCTREIHYNSLSFAVEGDLRVQIEQGTLDFTMIMAQSDSVLSDRMCSF